MSDRPYGFDGLPVDPVDPGSTVLVAGPTHSGTRDLALRLLAGPSDGGATIVSTNRRAARFADDCRRAGITLAADKTAIIDCVGEDDSSVPARVLPVSGPSDLTGIGMRYSDTYSEFRGAGVEQIRTGLHSVSTLLTFSDLQTVSRFVHTLVSRIEAVDGFGALLIDPTNHDERAVNTISQFCTGRIDVRERESTPELRVRGLPDQPREWLSFELADE